MATKKQAVERVEVRTPNVPAYRGSVERPRYDAMKRALLKVLPAKRPGLTQSAMFEAVLPHLPATLFPGGAKAMWWAKCVQLDLEARGALERHATKPLEWTKRAPR